MKSIIIMRRILSRLYKDNLLKKKRSIKNKYIKNIMNAALSPENVIVNEVKKKVKNINVL